PRPPPPSPPLPYTTLFRSPIRGFGSPSPAAIRIISLATGQVRSISLPLMGGSLGTPKAIWAKDGYLYTTWPSNPDSLSMARVNLDRKSTRLNSSHQIISYA